MVCVRPGAVVDDDDGFNEIILSISQIFLNFSNSSKLILLEYVIFYIDNER